ncbi:MAG: PAS domain S-box protein [Gemmatimonadales bacterium]|nr:PAS domain S-box protein [Gemmatimonadales bacterium]
MDDELYRLIAESSVDYAIFHIGLDGIVKSWNPGAERIFGFTPQEIVGRHGSILFVPEDVFRGEAEREMRFASETGRAQDSRWHLRKDGSRFWANGVMLGLRDRTGTLRGLAKIVRDDSGLKQSQELLHYQINLADAIASNAAEALFLIDREGRTTFANPSAEQMFGWRREELIGQFLHDKLHNRRADGSPYPVEECPHMRVLVTEQTLRGEDDFFVHRDGRILPVTCSTAPIRGEGSIAGAVLVVRDVTEQRRAEEVAREKDEAFRQAQKLESIGVLAGGIAHDFNNLLTGIMGNAGLARRAVLAGRNEKAADMLQDVLKASERAADLTRQLLAYAGKGQFVIQPVDACKLVTEVGTLIRASISKRITLVMDVPDECPSVEGDRTQLQQLVMNLVINGGEAIGDHAGTLIVRIRTEHFTERRERLRTAGFPISTGDYVRIDVIDTGQGMDKETRDRIFEPFFTTKFLGRGLGLSAALGIVRGHHGAIGVRSEPDKGTTFTVLLPVLTELRHLRRSGPEVLLERDIHGVGTVLVVDDDYAVRSLAASVLYEAGYTVELAEDGVQAIERMSLLGDRVSLVLLDLTMPQLGGAEAAMELRRLQPDIPIVAMSGYGDVEVMERFSGAHIDEFLPKPFTPDQLAAKVRDVLAAVAD